MGDLAGRAVVSGLRGGCLCGKVRYEIDTDPLMVATCHCVHCQKQSGSSFSLVVVTTRDALELTGDLATFEDRGTSGLPVWRRFCPTCGSPVLTDTPGAREHGLIFVKGGTVDDAAIHLRPGTHYWTDRRHDWINLPEADRVLLREEEG